MKIESSVARQKGVPLMIFNTTWSVATGAHKTRLVALVLGVIDDQNLWHPTEKSEDTMNRFNDVLPELWPYTCAVVRPGMNPAVAIRQALMKTPKQCGLLLCTCDVNDYKAAYHELNVQTVRQMV